MNAIATQIVTQYEDLGMTVQEICDDHDELDPVAVKATLMQYSDKFRRANAPKGPNDQTSVFTATEEDIAKRVIVELMAGSEDEHLRFRAARYVRDDYKGRLDPREVKKLNINVIVFNETLERARKAKQLGRSKVTALAPSTRNEVLDLQPA